MILYTTHCPKCSILKTKLDEAGLEYEMITDIETIAGKGFRTVPMLEIDGKILDFAQAIKYIKEV